MIWVKLACIARKVFYLLFIINSKAWPRLSLGQTWFNSFEAIVRISPSVVSGWRTHFLGFLNPSILWVAWIADIFVVWYIFGKPKISLADPYHLVSSELQTSGCCGKKAKKKEFPFIRHLKDSWACRRWRWQSHWGRAGPAWTRSAWPGGWWWWWWGGLSEMDVALWC